MRTQKNSIIRFGIIALLICTLCISLVSAAAEPAQPGKTFDGAIGQGLDVPVPANSLATDPVITGPATSDGTSAAAASAPTKLATPVLVSPNNGQALFNYPRVTTLAWKPVTGATQYIVERAYYDTTWRPYPNVIITGNQATSYTFTFVGDNPGHWRVTALANNQSLPSNPSAWWNFSYSTGIKLSTPVLTSPANNSVFYHYPRTTTLAWKPVPGATTYRIERKYCIVNTCWNYPLVNVTGSINSYYTFNFVGAQPGKWRVTAIGGYGYFNSDPSVWRIFTFKI